jgi:TIR domain
MAPEHAPALVIFDSRFEDDKLKGELLYVEVPPGKRLRVRFADEREPENFQPVGGGVAYVFKTDGLDELQPSRQPPVDLGGLRYRFIEGLNLGIPWVMFVLILPHGHTLEAAEPLPERAKTFKDRLALYWILKGDDLGRTEVECTLRPFEGSAEAMLEELNRLCCGGTPRTVGTIGIEDEMAGAAVKPGVVGDKEPDVYVSYAWGDESSDDAIKREEVVNQMCSALARTGRAVGRDKTVMQPGDSIDAFADKIAKAPRIVAVISEKSLHSKFCMVDEIYSAYQRSGFRRAEFQAKVIALVMDDAIPLLKEDIALARHWKEVYEKDRADLEAVDRERKSLERWAKVHRLGEMCDRILDMLDAIKDIIMPRGYENVARGNFQEVILRLPPKRD